MDQDTEKKTSFSKGEIILYRSLDGKAALDVRLEGETLWLNLNQIAGLFERDKSVISRHLSNVYKTAELDRGGQLLHFLQRFKMKVAGRLNAKSSISTSTPLYQWVIESIPSAVHSFASGPPVC